MDINNEQQLFESLVQLIDKTHKQVVIQINSNLTMLFWQVGKEINDFLLQHQRGEYGKQIVVTVSRQLAEKT